MKSTRENPDSPENQALERQADRDVFAAQQAHKKQMECADCDGTGLIITPQAEWHCPWCGGTGIRKT